MSQTIQRYGVRRRRDWRNPFSWFNWYWRDRPTVLYKYQPMGGNEHGATTSTRASTAMYVTEGGVVASAASGAIRDRHYINGRGPYTLLEGSRQNVCLRSEDFSAVWVAVGTPTLTPGADTGSGISLSLIGDDDGAANEYYYQAITFTGDGAKALSVACKAGTSPSATGSDIALWDNSASAYRLRALLTWSGGVPSVSITGGAGTYLGYQLLAGGVYRLLFTTNSVTAANVNQILLLPCRVAAEQGNVYLGGVQAENATFPSSYIPTVAAAVTRSADALSFPFLPVPQAMTWYFKFVESGTITTAFNGTPAGLIGGTGAANPLLYVAENGAGKYNAVHHNGTSAVTSVAAATPSIGDVVELRVVLGANGSVTLGQSINGAAEVVAATSAANTLNTAWASAVRTFIGTSAVKVFTPISKDVIASGVQTLDVMRAL